MALFPKTPGVYIEEIPRIPSSVAAVPTSVPVFIGFTEQVVIDGDIISSFPTNPIRIESLLQFETIFGGPKNESFAATLSGPDVNIAVSSTLSSYRLYYNMLMYFGNGGGPCYVIAAGVYPTPISAAALMAAIPKAEQEDEITMMVIPEAIMVSGLNTRRNIYNDMLAHCAKMQDRFSLMDVEVITTAPNTIQNDADQFRDETVGANNLSYGATYYPSFKPSFPFSYLDTDVMITATAVNLPANILLYSGKTLDKVNNGIFAKTTATWNETPFTVPTDGTLLIGGLALPGTVLTPVTYTVIADIVDAINENPALSAMFVATSGAADELIVTAVTAGVPTTIGITGTLSTAFSGLITTTGLSPDKALYNRIKDELDAVAITLYPSATMAGIYCAVDSSRGVWKAPANVGVTLVDKLNRTIKSSDQENLNVDATSGKSIDVLRDFPGRGLLVWGARTLDGNSNEWRYISVRRTFLFIEDSCKKATMFSVFEPNDMNTWLRVKGMISSFLTTIWRDGGLAGSKPEQAFFVKVGLGETMTAQDILEGRLIIQIGLAVVRPAEFIILQFEHKQQVS